MATDVLTNPHDGIGEINKYDFRTERKYVFKARKGLDAEIVRQISEMKSEPAWMRDFRLKSLEIFNSKPMPHWGGDIAINFQDIYYYLKPTDHQGKILGRRARRKSRTPSTGWAFPRPRRNSWPA